jgi:transposase
MQSITTIGLDIAKSVFQVHGVDAAGQVIIRRQSGAPSWRSSRSCHHVWLAEKLAPRLIIGRASCRPLDIRCG